MLIMLEMQKKDFWLEEGQGENKGDLVAMTVQVCNLSEFGTFLLCFNGFVHILGGKRQKVKFSASLVFD